MPFHDFFGKNGSSFYSLLDNTAFFISTKEYFMKKRRSFLMPRKVRLRKIPLKPAPSFGILDIMGKKFPFFPFVGDKRIEKVEETVYIMIVWV